MYNSLEAGRLKNSYEGRCRVDVKEPGSMPRYRGQPWLGKDSVVFNDLQEPNQSLIASIRAVPRARVAPELTGHL